MHGGRARRGGGGEPAAGSGIGGRRPGRCREGRAAPSGRRCWACPTSSSSTGSTPAWTGEPDPGLVATPLDEVADRFVDLIDEIRPTVVVTLDASDGHRDHVHVRDATLAAVDAGRLVRRRSVYLHCLPRELMQQWAELIRAEAPESALPRRAPSSGRRPSDITTVIDTAHLLDRRESAIAVHVSQTSPYEVMPPSSAEHSWHRAAAAGPAPVDGRPGARPSCLSPTAARAGPTPG